MRISSVLFALSAGLVVVGLAGWALVAFLVGYTIANEGH